MLSFSPVAKEHFFVPHLAGRCLDGQRSETITITVNEVNVAPVLGAIGNQTVDEQATLTFNATASDQDLPAQTLTYSLDAAAVALGMSITQRGAFSWTPTESQGGSSYSVTITVTDNGTDPANLTRLRDDHDHRGRGECGAGAGRDRSQVGGRAGHADLQRHGQRSGPPGPDA